MSDITILFGGDLHKRATDITTIEGYVQCTLAVQKSLIQMIMQKNINYFISWGDWYDKGYTGDVAASLSDYDLDIELMNAVHGNFYGLLGNHLRLNMDSNPELHIIQPHEKFKSRRAVNRTTQIMKTVDVLRVKDVQISFMHYSMNEKSALDYKPVRQDWAKYHIALFHSPLVVPAARLVNTNSGYISSPNNVIAETMENVDLAICGDIHDPIGKFVINKQVGSTIMVVPGSLTNTNASEVSRHSSIALPYVTISDDSEVKLEFIPFDLKTNMVTFKRKNVEQSREKLKSLRGKGIEDLHDPTDIVAAMSYGDDVLVSLNRYMSIKGYTDKDKKMVRSVLTNPENLDNLLKIYMSNGILDT